MHSPSFKFLISVLAVFLTLPLASCVFDREGAPEESTAGDDVQLIVRFRAVGSANTSGQAPVEAVKSLRIIIVDDNGYLDINEKLDINGVAAQLSQPYSRHISSGQKRMYLIANEESVTDIEINDRSGLPSTLPLSSLTAMLNHFSIDEQGLTPAGDAARVGKSLETALNRVYFNCDYQSTISDNNIYLPYSSCYNISIPKNARVEIDEPFYLVPVATKFDITFVNYRNFDVTVDDVTLTAVNSHNYLNAQLADGEKYRYLPSDPDKSLWWVDWLAQCATASQTAADNADFNQLWGWIKGYYLPLPDETRTEVSFNPGRAKWTIPAIRDKDNPSRLSAGPLYFPESINPPKQASSPPGDTGDNEGVGPDNSTRRRAAAQQAYYLNFKLREAMEDVATVLEGYEIDTLKALFRATHVVITVEFNDKDISIYAQIEPWKRINFHGFLQEDDD